MEKIKVCLISVYVSSLFDKKSGANFGGAEVQMYQLGKKLKGDKGFEVCFISYFSKRKKFEFFDGIKVYFVYPFFNKNRILRAIFRRILFFRRLFNASADVYIQRAAGIETGITCLFCQILRKKFIYMTAHEFECNGEYEKNSGISGKFFAYGIKNADLVIVQNAEHQKKVEKNYGIKSVIVRNSFNIPEKKENNKDKFILWVSSAQQFKQPEKMIALSEKFSKDKFIMIMQKNDIELWNKMSEKIRNFQNIALIEKVSFEKIGEYFDNAKIFVNTSTYEGFPNTFVQAAMYGTPIVSLNVNPDNFLSEWNCGYCAEGDFEKMVEQTKKLLTDEKDWQEKSKNAFAYAKANHDIEKNIEKIKNAIRSL